MRRRQSSTPQAPEEQPTYPIVDDSCSGGGGGKLVCPVGPEQVTVEAAPPPAAAATMPSGAAAAAAAIGGMQTPPPQPKFVIQPPIPPQHVYAPMPALGALSIGFLSKKDKKKEDADFRLITNGIITARAQCPCANAMFIMLLGVLEVTGAKLNHILPPCIFSRPGGPRHLCHVPYAGLLRAGACHPAFLSMRHCQGASSRRA